MSIESDLRKEGIQITSKLDTLKVNTIAKNIAQRLVAAFPEHDFKLGELFMQLAKLNMYQAKIEKGLSEANYHYKNTSIYFNEEASLDHITDYAMHECIHYLQERKDKQGHLLRLGLCDLTKFKLYGLGINEAAVQLATATAQKERKDTVKYYGISFETISPNCYPIECNLIAQMAYITGQYALFHSTFYSDDEFKNQFISLTDENCYNVLEATFDKILFHEELLIKLQNQIEQEEKTSIVKKLTKKIEEAKKQIQTLYFSSQNLILTCYFNKQFKLISNLEQVENFRRKLYHYKDLIGSTDEYQFFNEYYIQMMEKLEKKYLQLENGEFDFGEELAIAKTNKWLKAIGIIKKILFRSGEEYKKVD